MSSMRRKRNNEALVIPKLRDKMSIKLNKRQLLATHLLATGLSAKETANQIGIRQETISRWKKLDTFVDQLNTLHIEILETILTKQAGMIELAHDTLFTALNDKTLTLPIRASISLRLIGLFNGTYPIDQRIRESHALLKRQNELGQGRSDLFYIIVQYLNQLDCMDPNLSDTEFRQEVLRLLCELNKKLRDKN